MLGRDKLIDSVREATGKAIKDESILLRQLYEQAIQAQSMLSLELSQTGIIEQNLIIPVEPGTYDLYLVPDIGKVWYIGYIMIQTSANTSVEGVYIKACDYDCPEVLVLSVDKNTTVDKDFKVDNGANARCVQLRIRFSNGGTSIENQIVNIKGIEVRKIF